jgi:hypothetical protein
MATIRYHSKYGTLEPFNDPTTFSMGGPADKPYDPE